MACGHVLAMPHHNHQQPPIPPGAPSLSTPHSGVLPPWWPWRAQPTWRSQCNQRFGLCIIAIAWHVEKNVVCGDCNRMNPAKLKRDPQYTVVAFLFENSQISLAVSSLLTFPRVCCRRGKMHLDEKKESQLQNKILYSTTSHSLSKPSTKPSTPYLELKPYIFLTKPWHHQVSLLLADYIRSSFGV